MRASRAFGPLGGQGALRALGAQGAYIRFLWFSRYLMVIALIRGPEVIEILGDFESGGLLGCRFNLLEIPDIPWAGFWLHGGP